MAVCEWNVPVALREDISVVCFRTRKPLPPGAAGDLWLFVVDQTTEAGAPADDLPRFARVNQLSAAVWAKGGNSIPSFW